MIQCNTGLSRRRWALRLGPAYFFGVGIGQTGTEDKLIYCFDLDGTLCSLTGGDYESAQPFVDRIRHVNKLFHDGHTIKIFTARGATSKKPWRSLTQNQLEEWGVQHHELIMGKPDADLFIDDKATHSDSYKWD